MSVAPGQTLLHYRLVEEIGAGGMGVVYRATDTKLRRDVAIKVLPDDFAHDQERLARFEREAHVLASLNHPRIASIHGLEESNGVRFLVLELVEGEDLAQILKRGPLSATDAMTLGRQIAEGLESAHEKGIVHRDLKPANIKRAPDGKLKLLDFGLARATEADPARQDLENSPTITDAHTAQGTILGTAAYMSPEQARGKPTDARTDIWAFGCVLYQMLTGAVSRRHHDRCPGRHPRARPRLGSHSRHSTTCHQDIAAKVHGERSRAKAALDCRRSNRAAGRHRNARSRCV